LSFKIMEEISNHFVSHVGKLDGKWFMNGYWVEKPYTLYVIIFALMIHNFLNGSEHTNRS
jgi:hypothetical protein